MRTRVRMWQVVVWSGAILAVAIMTLSIASAGHMYKMRTDGGWVVAARRGGLYVSWWSPLRWRVRDGTHEQLDFLMGHGSTTAYARGGWVQYHEYVRSGPQPIVWWIAIPGWMCAAPPALISFAAWRLHARARRRALLNVCRRCGYDRTGLADGAACPECGGEA